MGRRIAITLAALLVYRIGAYLPLPGIDIVGWSRSIGLHARDIFGLLDIPAGGAARQTAIFALGITPYIFAAIMVQIASMFWPRLRRLSAAGDRGRDTIVALTLYLTLLLTAFQAYGVALALEGVHGLVLQPGLLFELSTVLTLTAGTMLLVWLGNQITARGIGNGLALILVVAVLIDLPPTVALALDRVRQGVISIDRITVGVILAATITALIVLVEGARRAIVVDYPQQTIGGTTLESRSAELLVKINGAGLIPAVIAGWLIYFPAALLSLAMSEGWRSAMFRQLGHGRPLFMVLSVAFIVLLTLSYTAFVMDPDRASETLKRHGGVVRGVAAGEPTAAYLDDVLSRVTLIGAAYLALLLVGPELLIAYFGLPFYLGGAPFLLVVCAALDIGAQVRQEAAVNVGGLS
jgi:preprotein translocase subunit SecY